MNNHASDEAVTTTVSALSDDRLLERTKELSRIEHHLEVVVIDHLREIQKRRLYLRRGFSSLFDYAVRELGYSDAAAWRRIKAMRLCADVDGVRERLRNGTMTLNAAAQLQHAFDRQERKKERAARSAPSGAGFGAAAQSQEGSPPPPRPPRPAERKPAPEPAPVLDAEARRELVEQASGKSSRQVMQLLAEVDPELAAPADRVRPLGGGRWELKAVIDDECRRGLERLKGLLSHVDPHITMGQLMGRLVREGLDRHDPARPPRGRRAAPAKGAEQTSAPKTQAASARGADSAAPSAAKVSAQAQAPAEPGDEAADRPDTSAAKPATDATSAAKTRRLDRPAAACAQPAAAPRPRTSAAKTGVTGRAIPAAVKREVWRRDRGRCRYVDRASGRRCGDHWDLGLAAKRPDAYLHFGMRPGNAAPGRVGSFGNRLRAEADAPEEPSDPMRGRCAGRSSNAVVAVQG